MKLDFAPPQTDRYRAHASLIIHLIAYLCGTCVQFEDWWFDMRVPLGNQHNIAFQKKTAEHFLSHAYTTWQGWPEAERKRFTNILFMLNRAPSYEWDWEHFTIEYMILDACNKIAEELGMVKKKGNHAERIVKLCVAFNLQQNENLRTEIVNLRNDLFHEALWEGAQRGTATGVSSFFAPLHLRRLNQRLVLAILGYKNEYVRSNWWSLGTYLFEIP